MPQVKASRRQGIALDYGLTQQPAPVHLKFAQCPSRDYRASIADHNNAVLSQPILDNSLDDRHWSGKGFPGHVQFMPYFGRELMRPGVKLERDVQVSQMPRENGRPLNVTAMGKSKDSVLSCSVPSLEECRRHDEAIASMRSMRGMARQSERLDNSHSFQRREVEHHNMRQQKLAEQAQAIKGMRTAGLASINPRLGTCGSLPDLNALRGKAGVDAWRTSTPWATDAGA
uniref:Uncharacterized protein n=1 Tax=Zooxanthella nutricula TaxID=1333877 RepID=A0A6U6NBY2_9DINO